MTRPIETVVRRAVLRTLALGGPVAAILAALVGLHFGLSVGVGTLLAAANLAAIGWLGRRILDSAQPDEEQDDPERSANAAPWVVLLVVKMMLLLGLALGAMVLGADPLGLAVGYSIFVVALVWETLQRELTHG
jgi:hypothetical protein